MTWTRIVSLALVALTLGLGACESRPEERPWPTFEAAGWSDDLAAFESAFDEYREAIAATPLWRTDARANRWVEGLASLAKTRADDLAGYIEHGLVSPGMIDLAKWHVDHIGGFDGEEAVLTGARIPVDSQLMLDRVEDEMAYRRVVEFLPPLERYIQDGVPSAWLDRHVLDDVRRDLRRVLDTTPRSREFWYEAPQDFDGVRARAVAASTALGS